MDLNKIRLIEACYGYLIDKLEPAIKDQLSDSRLVFKSDGTLYQFDTYQEQLLGEDQVFSIYNFPKDASFNLVSISRQDRCFQFSLELEQLKLMSNFIQFMGFFVKFAN